ncbi:peptidoglycan DD-metalloendopeptidase family protein [Chitinivorax sp. B]|uniref:peptidoglycan DD-metalloendopeptidase family protein n=1 Tax=Chitinivorax sp. B TaxID=2502235 RepID=UPI0010F81201|nr:peptidoglycan DD-metalloendopeptidase family protein [Chitinivorax sp. B]
MSACATHSPARAPVIDRSADRPRSSPNNIPPAASKRGSSDKEPDLRPETYVVKKGDTLYGIALEYGFDYRELAQWNRLEDPNLIKIDQVLHMKPLADIKVENSNVIVTPLSQNDPKSEPVQMMQAIGPGKVVSEPKLYKLPYSVTAVAQVEKLQVAKPAPPKETAKVVDKPDSKSAELAKEVAKVGSKMDNKPEPKEAKPEARPDSKSTVNVDTDGEVETWQWPSSGKVASGFAVGGKGIDIVGKRGQPVLAAAAGKVVYSGVGLRGYGKLLIIKHNKTYLTAYAHNQQLLVKEGEVVNKGEQIAEMGDSDTDKVKLHFEIRRFGKPVDPIKFLPADKS